MVRQMSRNELGKVSEYLKNSYNMDFVNNRIDTIHNAYLLLRNSNEVPDFDGTQRGIIAVAVGNSIIDGSREWKNDSYTVLDAMHKMIQQGLLNPAVIYETASLIEEQAQQTRRSNFIEAVRDTAGLTTEVITAVQEPAELMAKPYLGYLKIVAGLAVVGGGLYAYSLYTVNKLK